MAMANWIFGSSVDPRDLAAT